MRYDEYFVTVHGNAFIDFVGKRRAYAVRCKDDCYKIQISKDRPYTCNRPDWEQLPYSALPVVVRRRFDELAPVLAFYKASVSHD